MVEVHAWLVGAGWESLYATQGNPCAEAVRGVNGQGARRDESGGRKYVQGGQADPPPPHSPVRAGDGQSWTAPTQGKKQRLGAGKPPTPILGGGGGEQEDRQGEGPKIWPTPHPPPPCGVGHALTNGEEDDFFLRQKEVIKSPCQLIDIPMQHFLQKSQW